MSSTPLASALVLPPEQVGEALLAVAEDQWFDRKSPRVAGRDLADAIIAFANAEGGVLAVGLHGDEVVGVDRSPAHLKNAWRQAAFDFCVPPVRASVREIDCRSSAGTLDHVLLIEVEASGQVHANTRDEVYLRVGDENRKLTFQQRRELMYEKGQASYEGTPVRDTSIDDLDQALVQSYAETVHHPDARRLCVARGLVTPDGRATVAGLLLFGNQPQQHFPEAFVRVLRYRGRERGTGARQQLVEDVRCEGPIPHLLERARATITDLLPTRRALAADGRFARIGIIPRDAWLEGLVNAVVHRSYSVAGDHIRADIFDDRIEITSPGRFPGLVDLGSPEAITRFARNPRIARVCGDLQFGQELGEGIRRIFEEMRLAGLVAPSYVQTAGTVQLVLSAEAVDQELERRLPEGARGLVRVIRELERASTGDLVAETGLSRPALLTRLRSLESAGVVEWVGKSKRDPRAFWRLKID